MTLTNCLNRQAAFGAPMLNWVFEFLTARDPLPLE